MLAISADLSDPAERARVRGLVKWDGRDNTYTTRSMSHPNWSFLNHVGKPDDPPIRTLEQWATFLGHDKLEPGSQVVHNVPFVMDVLNDPVGSGVPGNRLRLIAPWSERKLPATVGPELDLLGPNEAYIRAAFGKDALPPERMRPEAPAAGPFVVVRDGKVIRAFSSLVAAVTAAQDGDAIEVRTDARTPGIVLPANPATGKRLTIRASPGYRPIIDRISSPDPWTVEGLHIESSIEGGIVRVANCTFGPVEYASSHSIALAAPTAGGVVEVVNCVVPGAMVFTLAPGQRARATNSAFSSIRVAQNGVTGPSVVELSRCVSWLPDSFQASIAAGGPAAGQEVEVQANGCIFESRLVLNAQDDRTAFRWSGDRNVYRTNPGAVWMWPQRVPDETILSLPQWRAAWGSDANSTMQRPVRFDPNAWKPMPNEKAIAVSTDLARIPAVRAGTRPTTPPLDSKK